MIIRIPLSNKHYNKLEAIEDDVAKLIIPSIFETRDNHLITPTEKAIENKLIEHNLINERYLEIHKGQLEKLNTFKNLFHGNCNSILQKLSNRKNRELFLKFNDIESIQNRIMELNDSVITLKSPAEPNQDAIVTFTQELKKLKEFVELVPNNEMLKTLKEFNYFYEIKSLADLEKYVELYQEESEKIQTSMVKEDVQSKIIKQFLNAINSCQNELPSENYYSYLSINAILEFISNVIKSIFGLKNSCNTPPTMAR